MLNKKVIETLENIYYTGINDIRAGNIEDYPDVPHVIDDPEYKTNIPFPPMSEDIDIKEPEIKTRKGKTILREPPEGDKPKDVEMLDKKGNEVEDWDDDLEDLDRAEPEEMVDGLEDETNEPDKLIIEDEPECKTPGEKIRSKGAGRGLGRGKGKGPIGSPIKEQEDEDESECKTPGEKIRSKGTGRGLAKGKGKGPIGSPIKEQKDEEDENGMGAIAQDNMGEQNPDSGNDPNIDPSQEQPDPSGMMGGTQDPAMGMDGGAFGATDPNVDPITGQPKLTAEQVGRIFELKKIYSRLLAIESQLSFSSDLILVKLRKFISESIELFETVISNIEAFKDEIDDIIVIYYDFLEEVYDIMKRYYKIKSKQEKKEDKNS